MDPVLEHHYNNIKEGKTRQDKDGYINTVVTIQVDKIKKLNNGKPTLIPTVYNGKIVSEKEAIKKAIDSGKKWTSADTHKQLREYDKKLHKQMSPELAKGTFNKGGTTMKNDPPVGSTPSEVADDIPAMISEGEFVIPADVVRYVGLDKIRAMMQEAKHGLACMEDEGLIVDVDEDGRPQKDQKEKSDDKVAIIETVQIEKVDPMMTQMAEGGMTDKDSPVSSPILNPENKPVMAEGGMVIGPDGSLRMAMQEGGMPMQMEDMMMEEMPSEEPEMAMPPELANEMAPQEAEPMPEAPMMNAPVAQEFNGKAHLMAYLQEDEIKALQEAGRGLDENGEQMLSPEGIPVFTEGETNDDADAAADEAAGTGMSGPEGAAADAAVGGGAHGGVSAPADAGADVGDAGTDSENEADPLKKEITKEIKKELSPEKDKTYVAGVGFIDKYIQERNSRPNPLQGKPAYAVATAAQGGLMRTPVHLQNGGMLDEDSNISPQPDVEVNEGVYDEDPIPSVASTPSASPVASEAPAESEAPATSSVPEGLMQPDGAIVSDSGITMRAGEQELRSNLFNLGANQATMDYLSQNFDVAQSILGDAGAGGADIDGSEVDAAALKHFNEFGKNEDRMGDGLYLAQQRLPDLVNEEGDPKVYAGVEGYYDAAKILETQPNISDESLDYLTKNKDVFRNAESRVASEEGTTYDDVAKQHYDLYGKVEGDRRGTEGLESFFSRPNLEEDTASAMPIQDTQVDSTDPTPTTGQQGFFTKEEKDNFVNQLGSIDMTGFENVQKKMKADTFIEREDGSFDLDPRSTVGSHLQNFKTADGQPTTPDKATYIKGSNKGQPLSRQLKMNIIEAQIDNLSNQYVE